MSIDLHKMSDDELYKRLGLIQSRLFWSMSNSSCGHLVNQLQVMLQEINMIISDKAERINFDNKMKTEQAEFNFEGNKEKIIQPDSNSRARSKSDIITRLRRTSRPTNERKMDE